jgi:hypothetical protein
MTTTSRTIVRQGIAAYFGGTFNTNMRAYQNGPLVSYGLCTVRAGYPKGLNQKDAFAGAAAGVMSGAFMVVDIGDDLEVRQGNAGSPVVVSNQIVAGGIKQDNYQVSLDTFCISTEKYGEDAQLATDALIEAMKQLIRVDRTLGGICMDAGETRAGIRTKLNHSGLDENNRTLTNIIISFEVRTQFIA